MRDLKTIDDFRKKVKDYLSADEKIQGLYFEHTDFRSGVDGNHFLEIPREVIQDIYFDSAKFDGIDFKNCTFRNVNFTNVTFFACSFENCSFTSCIFNGTDFFESEIISTSLYSCRCTYMRFGDVKISDMYFNNCNELLELYFGGCSISHLKFYASEISHSRFEPIRFKPDDKTFDFKASKVNNCYFLNLDLTNALFNDCLFKQSTFSNCMLRKKTFVDENNVVDSQFCSIDFQSIRISEALSTEVLNNVFGIFNHDLKGYITELTSEIIYQSVFISYSFKDREFAHKLYEKLKSRGVFCFLFEKDAPGGKRLKKIMSDGVASHDRLLFIASEHSIKSTACQFELTEGRKKQEKLWKTIYFPIHIDNYLFEIEMNSIPKKFRADYWENIEELKEINSMDFTPFNIDSHDEIKFDEMIDRLIEGLRK